MVPEELPPAPGYAIESVYRPAAQVGGDFFQVIQLGSGQTLVVVGDVSGKGLSAAMIVSMIIGMLHTISRISQESRADFVGTQQQAFRAQARGVRHLFGGAPRSFRSRDIGECRPSAAVA